MPPSASNVLGCIAKKWGTIQTYRHGSRILVREVPARLGQQMSPLPAYFGHTLPRNLVVIVIVPARLPQRPDGAKRACVLGFSSPLTRGLSAR